MAEQDLTKEEIADLQEFVNKSEKYQNRSGKRVERTENAPQGLISKEPQASVPGQVVQYAVYGTGYTPATATVPILPPGLYDINSDNKCTFVTPVPKPAGLLLELPEMRSEEVIRIVETFWNSEKDYKEGNEFVVGGAAFKAGIMVYGPPGSGKSCTLKLVANKLVDRGGTVFYANGHPGTVSAFLMDFALVEKNRKCIVILEDLDSLIQHYGEAIYLDMLDSARSINNVLFIATTNYPERLDPRIYNRPGRFSHVVKIGLPGPKTREAYLKAILKNYRDVDQIVEKSQGFTIDHLTALVNAVYREKKNLSKEIDRLKLLFNVPKVDDRTMGFVVGINNE